MFTFSFVVGPPANSACQSERLSKSPRLCPQKGVPSALRASQYQSPSHIPHAASPREPAFILCCTLGTMRAVLARLAQSAPADMDVRGLSSSKSNRGARRAAWSGRCTFFVLHGVVLHVGRHAGCRRRATAAVRGLARTLPTKFSTKNLFRCRVKS